mmetsp:Transcript_9843/g.31592  ORF Transcript_9843/g.31592 Transcript_9843/m.31592 type:complete len:223 (-) Transcript_9843:592-1260(-)
MGTREPRSAALRRLEKWAMEALASTAPLRVVGRVSLSGRMMTWVGRMAVAVSVVSIRLTAAAMSSRTESAGRPVWWSRAEWRSSRRSAGRGRPFPTRQQRLRYLARARRSWVSTTRGSSISPEPRTIMPSRRALKVKLPESALTTKMSPVACGVASVGPQRPLVMMSSPTSWRAPFLVWTARPLVAKEVPLSSIRMLRSTGRISASSAQRFWTASRRFSSTR